MVRPDRGYVPTRESATYQGRSDEFAGNVGMIAPGLFKPEQPKDFGDRKCSRNEGFKKLFGITPIAARHDAII